MFYASHKFIDPLSHACSLKNETAIDIVFTEINSLIKEQYKEENPYNFIPSEEDSVSSHRWLIIFIQFFIWILYSFQPILELIQSVTNTCSTKFNASSFTMAMDVMSRRTEPVPPKKSMCYIHCMLSELDFVRSFIVFQFSEFCITVWTAFDFRQGQWNGIERALGRSCCRLICETWGSTGSDQWRCNFSKFKVFRWIQRTTRQLLPCRVPGDWVKIQKKK